MIGDPIITRTASSLQARLPHEDVSYLREVAQLVLATAGAVALVVYLARGGRLVRLAPTS